MSTPVVENGKFVLYRLSYDRVVHRESSTVTTHRVEISAEHRRLWRKALTLRQDKFSSNVSFEKTEIDGDSLTWEKA